MAEQGLNAFLAKGWETFGSTKAYFSTLLEQVMQGEPTAIAVFGVIALIIFVVLFKVSSWVYGLIKRLFLLIIIAFSFYFFMAKYGNALLAEGTATSVLIVGAVGALLGLIAIITVILSFHGHWSKGAEELAKEEEERKKVREGMSVIEKVRSQIPFTPTQVQQPGMMTKQGYSKQPAPFNFFDHLRNDRSLLAVLSYVVVAELGVFTAVTVSPPNVQVGLTFFALFLVAAFLFIRATYHNYKLAVLHLGVALSFAIFLSIILGHFWAEIPFSALFSLDYFQTNSVVAVITGIAVSLFMGSKN